MNSTEPITIRGIIVPEVWDDQGQVLKLAIVTYDEDRVLIAPNTQGLELMSWLRKTVKLEGILTPRGSFREIEVLRFAKDTPPRAGRRKK